MPASRNTTAGSQIVISDTMIFNAIFCTTASISDVQAASRFSPAWDITSARNIQLAFFMFIFSVLPFP